MARKPTLWAALAVLAAVLVPLALSPGSAGPVEFATRTYGHYVRQPTPVVQDPWTEPLPTGSRLDVDSDAIASRLVDEVPVANLYRYGVPIYEAGPGTPRHDVECTESWGTCLLEEAPVPIPDGAIPAPGSDGALVVVDETTGRSYEFWQARMEDGRWLASWGSVVDISLIGQPDRTPGDLPTGAGVSRLAGVVRAHEIAAGTIPHALVFSTDNACEVVFRPPARKTDGRSSSADCIPQGSRVRLDPAVDLSQLDLTPAERVVGEAMQQYGAYAIDNGGAPMAIIFEHPAGETDPYPSAGLRGDYQGLGGLPWDRLQVLASWNGS